MKTIPSITTPNPNNYLTYDSDLSALNILPDDLIHSIFSHLRVLDIASIQTVCKHWNILTPMITTGYHLKLVKFISFIREEMAKDLFPESKTAITKINELLLKTFNLGNHTLIQAAFIDFLMKLTDSEFNNLGGSAKETIKSLQLEDVFNLAKIYREIDSMDEFGENSNCKELAMGLAKALARSEKTSTTQKVSKSLSFRTLFGRGIARNDIHGALLTLVDQANTDRTTFIKDIAMTLAIFGDTQTALEYINYIHQEERDSIYNEFVSYFVKNNQLEYARTFANQITNIELKNSALEISDFLNF